jgi:5-formyltetrahydrofolate cyclo-ligase
MREMAEAPVQRTGKTIANNCRKIPVTPLLDKKSLRKEIIVRRDSIPSEIKEVKDGAIEKQLTGLKAFQEARTILFYASFRSEVNTEKLIRQSLEGRRITVLPRVVKINDTLKLYVIRNWADLAPGSWGILEPIEASERELQAADIDIVLAPGVGFDESCNRLGYGKGYYDKLLSARGSSANKPLIVGLAYEEQIVPALPCNPHDIKMDIIISDKRIITCNEY